MKKETKNQNKAATSNNQKTKEKGKDSAPMTRKNAQEDINYAKYKVSTYIICTLVLLGASVPFWHRFVDENSTISYHGFENFSNFLYHFGVHFYTLLLSLFFLWCTNFISNSAKSIKKLIRWCLLVFMAISSYFLLWVTLPISENPEQFDYPKIYYQIALIFISISLTFTLFKLTKASFNYLDNIILSLRNKISFLIKSIFELRAKHFLPTLAKAIKRGNKNDFSNIREEIEKADLYIKESLTKVADD